MLPQLIGSLERLAAIGTHKRSGTRLRFLREILLWWQESWQAGCQHLAVGRFPKVHVEELPVLVHSAAHVALELGQ